MIPKQIHYCWFGGKPLPEDAQRCINSWKEKCPDYKLIRWDEKTFDVNSNPYTKEAAESKKWAFVTDYVRLYALYNFGGIYMDTDVEVLRNLDQFLEEHGFSGFEDTTTVPTGIMASEQGLDFVRQLLSDYDNRHFLIDGKPDITTNVTLITDYCVSRGLKRNNQYQTIDDFSFYPKEYFCPKDYRTLKIEITDNTYTIHHFAGTWETPQDKFRKIVKKVLGPTLSGVVYKLLGRN